MLANAFNAILALHSRTMTIYRPSSTESTTPVSIKMTPANYFRNLSGPDETVTVGREFVISMENLKASGFPIPKRGDRIEDLELGLNVVAEVREMYDLQAQIMGFRIRTE